MQYIVTHHAKQRFVERFRVFFSKEQLKDLNWLINHLISQSIETVEWKQNPFYVNMKGLNSKEDKIMVFKKKINFVIKGNRVVTCINDVKISPWTELMIDSLRR